MRTLFVIQQLLNVQNRSLKQATKVWLIDKIEVENFQIKTNYLIIVNRSEKWTTKNMFKNLPSMSDLSLLKSIKSTGSSNGLFRDSTTYVPLGMGTTAIIIANTFCYVLQALRKYPPIPASTPADMIFLFLSRPCFFHFLHSSWTLWLWHHYSTTKICVFVYQSIVELIFIKSTYWN